MNDTTSTRTTTDAHARTILICGAVILALSLGVRHTFGLFLQPMSMGNGWGREVFAFAIALQNLQPTTASAVSATSVAAAAARGRGWVRGIIDRDRA